ncbi:hypothetical protein [Streptomyces johnsoniae]|uniref:Uncharacterized protein n=1 Tax=Streptomyces johnsoniae TaxID=3075532 RepID=A0ABU2S0T5_9ACTN|nr:hypothetical protein [Streptomyces sp. DSM 41886]MDT0441195.1 hypothetical protein [Streptomyces sp. DSM 41886]
MATSEVLPEWLPVEEAAVLPSGRWWDAVRVTSLTGTRTVSHLRERSGPVIEDQALRTMTWLVPVGSSDGWARAGGIWVLGAGLAALVPPAESIGGPWSGGESLRWLIPPTVTCLTDPGDLHDALEQVR